MPLAHKKSNVVFIMTYHLEPLERLEKMLTKKQLDTWFGKLKETAVAVSLPKVSMEVSHDLQVKDAAAVSGPMVASVVSLRASHNALAPLHFFNTTLSPFL